MATAKIFMHGRSQAVRLLKEFRLPGAEARVSREGNKVILEPIEGPGYDSKAFWAAIDAFGGEFPEPDDSGLRPGFDDDPSFD